MNREAFVSAMKRKDVKALGALILRDVYDQPEKAKELEDASRLTIPLINRTCVIDGDPIHPAEPSEPEETEEESMEAEAAIGDGSEDKDTLNIGEIKALLAKGDKKSIKTAKKAFEAQFAEDHPNYKELKKAIKKAKKALEDE